MNTTEAIRARRSIRKYKPDTAIPQEHVDLLLEAAMCAPSAMNKRPWSFIVVESPELRGKIADAHPFARFLKEAPLGIIVCGDSKAYPQASGKELWPQDCAAATQTILLQATELGYGSCWSAVYPNDARCAVISELLGIHSAIPFSIVAIGLADEQPDRRGFYDKSKVRYIR